jgi:hypothetical protein
MNRATGPLVVLAEQHAELMTVVKIEVALQLREEQTIVQRPLRSLVAKLKR